MIRRAAPGVAPRRADGSFQSDDAHRDSPDQAAPQDDGDWFQRNPARRHRLRKPIGAELALCAPSPGSGRFHGWTAVFAVRRTRSGKIIRLPIPWPPQTPLLGEQRAKAVFDWSARMFARLGQTPADVEARLRLAILRSSGAAADQGELR